MMIVLALLLLAVATLLIVAAVVAGGDSVAVEVFNLNIETAIWGVFLAGVVTALIALAGIAALTVGIRQTQAHRREFEYLRQKVAEQEQNVDQAGPKEPTDAQEHDSSDWGHEASNRPTKLS